MKFSEKLYNLRTKTKMSQEELAGELGVSRQAVSKWELGASLPDTEKLIEISEYFNVSIDYLVKNEEQRELSDDMNRIIIQFLNTAKDMDRISGQLIEIARDGIIDSEEKEKLREIIETLDSVSDIVNQIKIIAGL